MRLFKLLIISVSIGFVANLQAENEVVTLNNVKKGAKYRLLWEYKNIPFKFSLYEAPLSAFRRVSETKIVDQLGSIGKIPVDSSKRLQLMPREVKLFYLVAKNESKKTLRFAVAPHETQPQKATLGFVFDCLCNGHVYEIPPGKTWYRIVKLEAFSEQEDEEVDITHTVFAVDK